MCGRNLKKLGIILSDLHQLFYKIDNYTMNNLKTYLSTAPVLLTVWMSFTAGLLIEANRFYPDALFMGY
jgi:photosystem I subunit 9